MDRHRADGGGEGLTMVREGGFTIFWCDILTSDDHTLAHSEPHTHTLSSVCVSEADVRSQDFNHTKSDR